MFDALGFQVGKALSCVCCFHFVYTRRVAFVEIQTGDIIPNPEYAYYSDTNCGTY